MGIDLRLLPCEIWQERDGRLWGYSHTVLELGGICEDDWNAFQTTVKPHLAELPTGHDVASFLGARATDGRHEGEHVYGTFRATDSYGEPFKVVAARDLLPWLVEHFTYDGERGGPYHAAIVAYVRALPPDTKIVLDWH